MSLDLMHLQAELERQSDEHPIWVSAANKSLEAWQALKTFEKERQAYIKSHRKPVDFKKNSLWQIRVSEVANTIGVRPSYLDPKRGVKWSSDFREALDKCNRELAKRKVSRVETYRKNKANGLAAKKRDEIDALVRLLRKENEALNNKLSEVNLEGMRVILSLPVKKALNLDF
ncbi:hypothetical protein NB663_07285 [Vibrio parahaemolyticus]|uniref:hypothetical protein n=1 Tax=Vibrio parahaemolyticus TaxID=670 RepID=UPI00215BC58A|nr:hypothetical protein [Vibrio parahaemolyticus]MCR9780336.1 hypothetical protein [Vibrio parahaemolyticus]